MLGWLLGNREAAAKTVDAVISTGDKLFYTDEEKADFSERQRQWYLDYLKATQPAAVARRLIALVVCGVWALMLIAAMIAGAFDNQAYAEYLLNLLDETVSTPFSAILGFYFLNQIIRDNKGP